jgi:hypothetical protein
VSAKEKFSNHGGYRSPTISVFSISSLMLYTSSVLSCTFLAATFSSRYLTFFVPLALDQLQSFKFDNQTHGIGIISSPWARIQASVNCPVVQPFLAEYRSKDVTNSKFFGKFVLL